MRKGTKFSGYILFTVLVIGMTLTLLSPIEGIPIQDQQSNYIFKKFHPYDFYNNDNFVKRGNAEIMNGLLAMDLGQLSAVGKRSNAELINGLIGMDLDGLYSAGK